MAVFIQVSVDADDVISAMNDDSQFTLDIIKEIATGFHQGLLLDNVMDLLTGIDEEEAKYIINQFKTFVTIAESSIGDDS